MPQLFGLTFEEREGLALARLAGEVDVSNAEELGASLRAQVSNRVLALILDLSEVEYMDSYGLAVLFDLNRRLERRRQRLRLVVPAGAHLRRVLELVGLDSLVGVHPSIALARASLATAADEGEAGL